MLGLKSVNVLHPLMSPRQTLPQLVCLSAPWISTPVYPTPVQLLLQGEGSQSHKNWRIWLKKRARYAQRTEGQRLHDAHLLRTRRARQQQQANVNAATEATLQAQHEETTRRAGNYSAVVRCTKLLNREIRRMSVRALETKYQRIYIF